MAGDLTQSQLESLLGVSYQQIERALIAQGGRLGAALAGSLTAKVKRLQDTWGDIGTSLGEAFLPAAKLMADVGQAIVSVMRSSLLPVFADLKAGITSMVGGIQGFLTANAGTFKYWGGTIRQIVGNVANLIKTGIAPLFAMLTPDKGSNFWGPFNSGVTRALEVVATLTSSWGMISEAASFAWEEIKDYAIDFWGVALQYATDTWQSVQDYAMSAWDATVAYAAGVWEEVLAYGQSTWDSLTEAAETSWDYVCEQVELAARLTLTAFADAWDAIPGLAAAAWDWITESGKSAWESIKEASVAAWGGIKSAAVSAWEGVKAVWDLGIDGLWERMKSGFVIVWEFITGKLSKISDYFSEWFASAEAQAEGKAESDRLDKKEEQMRARHKEQQAVQQVAREQEAKPGFVGPVQPIKVEVAGPPERPPEERKQEVREDRFNQFNQRFQAEDRKRQEEAARRDREDAKKDRTKLKLEEEKKEEVKREVQQVKISGLTEFRAQLQQGLKPDDAQVPKKHFDEAKKQTELLKEQKDLQQQMLKKVFGGPQPAVLG